MDVVNDATLTDAVAQAWAESSALLHERVAVLEGTALAVLDGTLSVERRAEAEREAHKPRLEGVAPLHPAGDDRSRRPGHHRHQPTTR